MTKIEWADKTWNPVTGCSKISEGCRNCYAERMAKRLSGRFGYPKIEPFEPVIHKDKMADPMYWRGSKKIFVCSMGDLFHEKVKQEWIARVFSETWGSKHIFIFLTKRPENMKTFFKRCGHWQGYVTHNGNKPKAWGGNGIIVGSSNEWPSKNIWLGVTAETQEQADNRIPVLLQIPASVRFVSVEPMLEHLDLGKYLKCESCIDPLVCWCGDPRINWVICGGETGPGARPMKADWVRSLRDQCIDNLVPFYFKQWGEYDEHGDKTGKKISGRLLDGKTWGKYPEAKS